MIQLFKNINLLLFPPLCVGCEYPLSDNEELLCTQCRHQLPLTNIHINNTNIAEKIFFGRVRIEKATAMFWFEKQGIVQHLIHQLKYKGHEEIGELLGKWLGTELLELENYNTIDAVIPVPIHPKKRRKRGYNQVETFGMALAGCLNATYLDAVLIKTQHTKTQTYKSRLSRWNSMQHVFTLQQAEAIAGKHILLVDDVITTGATLEVCARELLKVKNVRISIATMAIVA